MCCQCLALLGLSTGHTAPDAGYSLFMRLVWLDFNWGILIESTGCSGCVWWCESGVRAFRRPLCARVRCAPSPVRSCVCRPLCTCDRWVPDASGAHLVAFGGPRVTVRVWRTGFKGGHVANSRASDAGGRASGGSLLSVRCPWDLHSDRANGSISLRDL